MKRNSNIKQPGIEEKDEKMSRHLDVVATSTLHQKQAQHQLANEEVVTKTSGCRDNNSTKRTSRQHQAIATSAARTRKSRRQ